MACHMVFAGLDGENLYVNYQPLGEPVTSSTFDNSRGFVVPGAGQKYYAERLLKSKIGRLYEGLNTALLDQALKAAAGKLAELGFDVLGIGSLDYAVYGPIPKEFQGRFFKYISDARLLKK